MVKKKVSRKQVSGSKKEKKEKPAAPKEGLRPQDHKPKTLSWEAPEFHFYPKGTAWSVVIAIATFLVAWLLISADQILGALVVVLAMIVFYQLGRLRPRKITFTIDQFGVHAKGKLHLFKNLKSFWIFEHEKEATLYLRPKKRYQLNIALPLDKNKIKPVQEKLGDKLKEEETFAQDLSDFILRLLRL